MPSIVWIRKVGCAILLLTFVVFVPYTLQAQGTVTSVDKTVTRLAVIPFQAVVSQDKSSTIRCPICSSVNAGGIIAKGAEKKVEEIFNDKLRDLKNVEIIPLERVAGVYQRTSTDFLKQPLLQAMLRAGSELRADVIAVGYVYRYRERVGYDYSTEHPASVAFEIHLISVKDGNMLWRGIFDKTQKSLMEDVFQIASFLKGGAKWLTARELTKLGVDEVFSTFSGFEP